MANMHLVTGYAGTDHITAADQGSWNAAIVGSGEYVLKKGNQLAATVISSNQIRIADGDILMQGRHVRLNEGNSVDLTIENGAQGYYRNDLIVARYTKSSSTGVEEVNLVVIKGTASTSAASDPEYTAGDIITDHALQNDMPLYRVPLSGLSVGAPVPLFSVANIAITNLSLPDAVPTMGSTNAVQSGGVFTAMKSLRRTATIGTTWTDNSDGTYSQTIPVTGVKANSIVEVYLPSTATVDQAKAFRDLALQDGGQASGSIILKAYGIVNTINIPIGVIVRSDS